MMLQLIESRSDNINDVLFHLHRELDSVRGQPDRCAQVINRGLDFAEMLIAHPANAVWPAGNIVSILVNGLLHPENAEIAPLLLPAMEARANRIILGVAQKNGQSATQAQSDMLRLAARFPVLLPTGVQNAIACSRTLASHDAASAFHLLERVLPLASDPAPIIEGLLQIIPQARQCPMPVRHLFNKLTNRTGDAGNTRTVDLLTRAGVQAIGTLASVRTAAASLIADDLARLSGLPLDEKGAPDFVSRSFMHCRKGPEGTGRVRVFFADQTGEAYVRIDDLPNSKSPPVVFSSGGTLGDFAQAVARQYPDPAHPVRAYYGGIAATAHRIVQSPALAPDYAQAVGQYKRECMHTPT